jgi:hypothetical protein
MKHFRASIPVIGLLAIIAVLGTVASGAFASTRPTLVTSQATDVWRFSSETVRLEPGAGIRSDDVVYVRLPAGDWILSMDLTAVTLGNQADIVRCGLFRDNNLVSYEATSIGTYLGTLAQNISTTAAIHSTTSFLANIKCIHDRDQSGQNVPYIDPGATIWAHKAVNLQ